MSRDVSPLIAALGAELTYALSSGQRDELLVALDADEEGTLAVIADTLARPDVTSPAALLVTRIRAGDHTQRTRRRVERQRRASISQLDFALQRYRVRLARHGDPDAALRYAVEWTIHDHGSNPYDAAELESALRTSLGQAAGVERPARADEQERWQRVLRCIQRLGPGSELAQTAVRLSGPGVEVKPGTGAALLVLYESTARRHHAATWAAEGGT